MRVSMFSGFDFGTSNCAMGIINNDNEVRLLPIDEGEVFMPSTLYSLDRDLICESAALLMTDKNSQDDYMFQRTEQLASARRVHMSEDIPADMQTVFVILLNR
jgi:hypothetical chaperone protein